MTTPEQLMDAAMDIAAASVDGRIKPTDIETEVVTKCRELVGVVMGPNDPMWPLQIDITRQVLHAGGLTVDEVAEWLAVMRTRAGVVETPAVSWIETALAGDYTEVDCMCGETINTDMPHVEPEARAGVLWHGNAEGGGHASDVDV